MTHVGHSPIFVQYEKAYRKPFIGMMRALMKSCTLGCNGVVESSCARPGCLRTVRRVPVSLVVALLVALSTFAAPPVYANVLSGDRVGGTAISSSESLRRAAPDVSARSGALVTEDGRVLWARRPDARRAIASVTKVMTALVVLDHLELTDSLTVAPEAASVGESGLGLRAGDKISVRDALSAMLVRSANDAALALAIRAAGSEDEFVALMNAKASDLGLRGTHFANPHGLDEPGHYSTAEDVAVMSRVAMAKPVFRDIVRRTSVRVRIDGGTRTLDSSNILLETYVGANGLKTGWTSDSGYCLVASARRGEIELFAVVLGAESERARFEQAARLLDWGFEHYRPVRIATSASVVGTATVTDYIDRRVLVLVSRDETETLFDLDGKLEQEAVYPRSVRAPIEWGQKIGTLRVTQGARLVANVPLVADRDVPVPGFFERAGIALRRLWRRLFD